jgi:ElaB/YqjD/DUF883 family membrane-anchored ribosome-binding protein
MSKHRHAHHTHSTELADTISEQTHELIAATADVADAKVAAVRNRLASALSSAKETYGAVQEKAIARAKVADKYVHAKPYRALGVAFGVGTLVGFLWSRRKSSE